MMPSVLKLSCSAVIPATTFRVLACCIGSARHSMQQDAVRSYQRLHCSNAVLKYETQPPSNTKNVNDNDKPYQSCWEGWKSSHFCTFASIREALGLAARLTLECLTGTHDLVYKFQNEECLVSPRPSAPAIPWKQKPL
eukprot:4701659-Amphidinium_carterae.1